MVRFRSLEEMQYAEQIQNQGTEPISHQSNPLTTVYELVEYLNSKI